MLGALASSFLALAAGGKKRLFEFLSRELIFGNNTSLKIKPLLIETRLVKDKRKRETAFVMKQQRLEGSGMTAWGRYAVMEYARLAMEEEAREQDQPY